MKEVSLQNIINDKNPDLLKKYPKFLVNFALWYLNGLFRVKKINKFIRETQETYGYDFIEKLFKDLKSTWEYDKEEINRIPKEGPVLIVANHPLGALDGLAIVRAVSDVRPDVKIVVNDILSHLTNLADLFLPVDVYTAKSQRRNLANIASHLKDGKAIIFFPAGIVSRMENFKVRDRKWTKGAVGFGRKYKAPIVAAKIENRNSLLFYFLTKLKDDIAPFLFPREMFNFVNKKLKMRFGQKINTDVYQSIESDKELTDFLKEYVYDIDNPPKKLKQFM